MVFAWENRYGPEIVHRFFNGGSSSAESIVPKKFGEVKCVDPLVLSYFDAAEQCLI